LGIIIRYQRWYNTYEGRKVSRVAMCEVRFRKKPVKNKPLTKYTMVSNEKKWTTMNPIRLQMKKRNPPSAQNDQLVHWCQLVHSGPGIVDCDSTRKAARKSQKLCICKSHPLFQTFTHYTLPHSSHKGTPYVMDKMPYRWLLSGGKTTPCGLDGMAMETVKTSRNFELVLDGQLWGVICHILQNFLCDVLRASPPHTCKYPSWLNRALGWCKSCCAPILMTILQWSFKPL
jgi:hypothetical protein